MFRICQQKLAAEHLFFEKMLRDFYEKLYKSATSASQFDSSIKEFQGDKKSSVKQAEK